ncbi:MAG: DoxX family membrane protein [Gemmatimonadetes bacterium]|nr:DoxX family membrane protein [Gemmatimonadota bacterium]
MKFLFDRRLVLVLRIALGVVFILAALPKLADPYGFARSISHYHLVPEAAERVLALVLPPLELLLGIGLILGVLDLGASVLAFGLLLVFTTAIAVAVGRGLDISCGCFDTDGGTKVGAMKLVENALMIGAAYLVMMGDRSLASIRAWRERARS